MNLPRRIALALSMLTLLASVPFAWSPQETWSPEAATPLKGRAGSLHPEHGPELDRLALRLAGIGFSGSVYVERDGEVLLHAGYGRANREREQRCRPDTVYDIGSLTKQFTAAAILRLAEAGALRTSDPLYTFFPEAPVGKRAITLHQLLRHTSGLDPRTPVGSATKTRGDFLLAVFRKPLTGEPGKQYAYNNVGYELLAAVIERVTGERFEDHLKRELFQTAGLRDTSFLGEDDVDTARTAHGYEGKTRHGAAERGWYSWGLRGAGGVLSTTGDLARWMRALRSGRVLSSRYLEALFDPGLAGYAYGWRNVDASAAGELGPSVGHGGTTRGFWSQLTRYPRHDLLVIVLCNADGKARDTANSLARAAAGLDVRLPDAVEACRPDELEEYVGAYELDPMDRAPAGRLKVFAEEGGLALQPDREAALLLTFGTQRPRLERDGRAKARVAVLLAALQAGRASALKPLLSPRFPNWATTLVREWQRWDRDYGALEDFDILGHDGRTSYVLLESERRAWVMALHFEDERLSGFSLNGRLQPGKVFLRREDDTFLVQDRRFGRLAELVFARDDEGRIAGLELELTTHGSQRRVSGTRR